MLSLSIKSKAYNMVQIFQDMVSNMLYLISFAVVAAGLFACAPAKSRTLFLTVVNLLFYALVCGWSVLYIVLTSVWSWCVAGRLGASRRKKGLLALGIVPLLLMLCTFKYWNNFGELTGVATILLPLGMSYYVLKSISYLVDVYRNKYEHDADLFRYLSYVSFFGQIIAGPIQRYDQWMTEVRLQKPKKNFGQAYYHFVAGLFMKVVIANRLAGFVMEVMNNPASSNGVQLWLAFFLYAVYIYCDFAGYSHIAIGITNLFGIECADNFKRPYLSLNIREFWSRWHISLSSWLRDYVYIPLGGNRKGTFRRALNSMITFLICGIWHGSTLNFAFWGIYHGILNVLTPKKMRWNGIGGRMCGTLLTIMLVCVGWVFFSTPSFAAAGAFFVGMFTRLSLDMNAVSTAILPFTYDSTCIAFFLVVSLFIAAGAVKEVNDHYQVVKVRGWMSFAWQVFLLTSVMIFGQFGSSSFIYAGF